MLGGLGALRREGSAVVNLLGSGPDLLLRTDAKPDPADRLRLAGFARALGLPRLHWALGEGVPEPIWLLQPAIVHFAGVAVTPPPGGFLQASEAGERAIVAALVEAIPAGGRVAELYAGCGTLTFPLAQQARVWACEGDALALPALREAAKTMPGRVTAEQRDLARRPVTAPELRGFAAVVLDPPHAGAAAQVSHIAASGVGSVIYVSCNPAALARDARMLHGGGYRLVSARPVDQFLWSARLESVCVFAR